MVIAQLTTDNREPYREYDKVVPWFGAAPEALLQGFAKMADLEIHVISCAQQPMKSPEKLADNIWFHSLHVPKLGWLRTGYQGCIRAVRKTLRAIQPDIVHGQGTERDCAISALFSGFPNVVTLHGNMAELARLFPQRIGSYGWLAARLENFTLKRAGGVFCNSEYTESLVRNRARRFWRVPNAIREELFSTPKGTVAPARCTLLNIGVISPRKRQLELLERMAEMHRRGLEFDLEFIGVVDANDAYGAAFLKAVEAKQGCARYLGLKSTQALIACCDRASGLIHFPTEEAFGLVVAESLVRGLKLFGSRVGGIIDIATGVEGAELFEKDDWAGLEAAIARWIGRGSPRPLEAAALMRERYHPDAIARRHLEIYREVLKYRPVSSTQNSSP